MAATRAHAHTHTHTDPQPRGASAPDFFGGDRAEVDLAGWACEMLNKVQVDARLAKCVQAFCMTTCGKRGGGREGNDQVWEARERARQL